MDKKLMYTERIKSIINSRDNIKKTKSLADEIVNKRIFLYGAGNAGTMTYELLNKNNINIEGFLDRNGGENKQYFGKPVYKSNEDELNKMSSEDSVIIISFICGHKELAELKERLIKIGWKSILYYHDIYNCLVCGKRQDSETDLDTDSINDSELKKISYAASLIEDDKSFEIMESFFKAIIYGKPQYFVLPTEEPQYFVKDISFNKGYSRFIDCGAYNGDTAYELKKNNKNICTEAIVLFEPDNKNFSELCKNLRIERVSNTQILFPCGVWKNNEILKFKSGLNSTSGVSDDGDTYIQCVAIDDVIGDFAPTFIKMDIEGAEIEAIKGAENTIKKYVPDLAISVYHRLEHLWEIPILLNNIEPSYKFYLRSHALHGMETILYATTEK